MLYNIINCTFMEMSPVKFARFHWYISYRSLTFLPDRAWLKKMSSSMSMVVWWVKKPLSTNLLPTTTRPGPVLYSSPSRSPATSVDCFKAPSSNNRIPCPSFSPLKVNTRWIHWLIFPKPWYMWNAFVPSNATSTLK